MSEKRKNAFLLLIAALILAAAYAAPQMRIKPDAEDFAAVEQQYGRSPIFASDKEVLKRYQRAQAAKLMRLNKQEIRDEHP
jgi:hypothetical protein